MHHDIIEVVAVVNKNNLYIYRDTRNKTIENNDVIKDIFVVNDENIYDNINDAVNDSATDKAIDFYTLPYRTTGAGVNIQNEINKKYKELSK